VDRTDRVGRRLGRCPVEGNLLCGARFPSAIYNSSRQRPPGAWEAHPCWEGATRVPAGESATLPGTHKPPSQSGCSHRDLPFPSSSRANPSFQCPRPVSGTLAYSRYLQVLSVSPMRFLDAGTCPPPSLTPMCPASRLPYSTFRSRTTAPGHSVIHALAITAKTYLRCSSCAVAA
jgi:hypothetical protein